ncbi:MAG: peptidoglycan -binding protein [Gammaproteobacteria bacterium]|jgi:chemotaxis protein MotB
MLVASRRSRTLDIWPGFVDALAALLMVVIFVLLLFSLGQFLLNDALIGRDEALSRLRGRMNDISGLLDRTREDKQRLEQRLQGLSSELQDTKVSRDDLEARLQALNLKAHEAELALAALQLELNTSRERLAEQEQLGQQQVEKISGLEAEGERLQTELATNRTRLSEQEQLGQQQTEKIRTLASARDRLQADLDASRQQASQARGDADELNARLATLNEQIARLNKALDTTKASLKDKTLEVDDLGARLNTALADKVEELASYRSEFFGKLREALKDNPDVRVEGDRFLLPSEVLFSSASADLDKKGRKQLAKVAQTLKEIMAKIPDDMEWVLRVDGHTDRRPIHRAFPSNWELSSARATSIVKDLIEQGVPPEHLVAAGFAQYHPVDPGNTAEAYRRNRRIELKLTSR